MTRPRRPRPPLDRGTLDELALRYVARFATSRAKLAAFLKRKVRERGWAGETEPPVAEIVARLSGLGYVDDAAFAAGRARALGSRGYGPRRVSSALAAAGIAEPDAEPAMRTAEDQSATAALHFARKRRIGPYADSTADRATREKWLAAMVRAGHDFRLARRLIDCAPGDVPDEGQLRE